jgi:predicted nucleic acid-binding protein
MTTVPNLVFIDTNILIYAHYPETGKKFDIATDIVGTLWREGTGVLSTQVLQEFYRATTQKMKPAMPHQQAREVVADYSQWCSVKTDTQLLISASLLHERHNMQWWDALVIEGAMRSGAKTLLSEDMQHGQRFGELTVRNPFSED